MSLAMLFDSPTVPAIGTIELDAVVSETHKKKAKATKYPVEYGGTISDHVFLDPESITISGVITNSPVEFFSGLRNFGSDLVQDAFDALNELIEAKTPVDVVTKLKTYENMIIEPLTIPRNAKTGDSIRFTATLTKITTVKLNTVLIPASLVSTKNKKTGSKGSSKVNAGNKQGKELDAGTEAVVQDKSWAKQIDIF